MRSDTRLNHMMTCSSASALRTSGGSASAGRRRSTLATRSRTSLAAASMSRLRSNSMVIWERAARLLELMAVMPAMPATLSSSSWVTRAATTAAEAPMYSVRTDTMGGSMSGYSRRVRRSKATLPKTTSSRLMTMAKTGRRTAVSDSSMSVDSPGGNADDVAGADRHEAVPDDQVPGLQAGDDLRPAGLAPADLHLHLTDPVGGGIHHPDKVALLPGQHRFLRHRQGPAGLAAELHLHQQAGLEQQTGVVEFGLTRMERSTGLIRLSMAVTRPSKSRSKAALR